MAILCFVNLKVKVTKYRMLFDRFEFSDESDVDTSLARWSNIEKTFDQRVVFAGQVFPCEEFFGLTTWSRKAFSFMWHQGHRGCNYDTLRFTHSAYIVLSTLSRPTRWAQVFLVARCYRCGQLYHRYSLGKGTN